MLAVAEAMLADLHPDPERMRAAVDDPAGFLLATEAADWLAKRGVPFREAHEAVGGRPPRRRRAGRPGGAHRGRLALLQPKFEEDVLRSSTRAEACAASTSPARRGPRAGGGPANRARSRRPEGGR